MESLEPRVVLAASTEIVFVDSSIWDENSVPPALTAAADEVVVLDSSRDGIQQIADYVGGRSDINAINILSHGEIGEVSPVGNSVLSIDNISDYANQLATIGAALTADGDILLWGCGVAGNEGTSFVSALAAATGADIAASNDLTGSPALGGDWDLEYSTGQIEATNFFASIDPQIILSHFRGGSVTHTVAANGRADLEVFTVWRQGAVNPSSWSGWSRTSGAIVDSGTELGGGGFQIQRETFTRNLTSATAFTTSWSSCCRVSGGNNFGQSYWNLSTRIVWAGPGTTAASPTIRSATIDIVAQGNAYNQNLNSTDPDGTPVSFQFLVGGTAPASAVPGLDLDSFGNVSLSGTETAALALGRWGYKTRVTDGNGAYAERDVLFVVQDPNSGPINSEAPELSPIGSKVVAIGQTLTFNVTAHDHDPDSLTIRAQGLPAGSTLPETTSPAVPYPNNTVTSTFTWTPVAGQEGVYFINVEAFDNVLTPIIDSEQVQITVTGSNNPPVLDPIGNKTVANGGNVNFTVGGSDPDLNNLTFSADFLPTGATFNPSTRVFNWTPSAGQSNNLFTGIKFRVTDDGLPNLFDEETIAITVGAGNQPPVFTPIANQTVPLGQPVNLTIVATDAAGQTIDLTPVSIPAGAAFPAASGTGTVNSSFSWTPAATGLNSLRFKAQDNGSPSASSFLDFDINVVPAAAPEVTVNVAPSAMDEDDAGTLDFTFTRSGNTASSLTVDFSVGGAAAFSSDYSQSGAASFSTTAGTVTFPANSSTAIVHVDPSADADGEPDETVILTVLDAAAYDPGTPGAATGTIKNDDLLLIDDAEMTNEDTTVDVDVLGNDDNIPGNPVVLITSSPTNGTATVLSNKVHYEPDPHFSGVDTIQYAINPFASPTTANDDTVATQLETAIDVDVLANDTDPQGDPLTPTVTAQPANGTASVNPDKTIKYTPNAGFSGFDTFTYQIDDGNSNTDTATVTVNVRSGAFGIIHYLPPKPKGGAAGNHSPQASQLWITTEDPAGASGKIIFPDGRNVPGSTPGPNGTRELAWSVTPTSSFRQSLDTNPLIAQTGNYNTIEQAGVIVMSNKAAINVQTVQENSNAQHFLNAKSTDALGSEFFAGQYLDTYGFNFISAMAVESGVTNVTFEAGPLMGSTDWSGHSSQTVTVPLQQYETYIIYTSRDITGSRISTASGEKIVVHSGTTTGGGIAPGVDNGIDQLVPVDLVGSEYVAVRNTTSTDRVDIVATQDGTDVTITHKNGGPITLATGLQAGQRFQLNLNFTGHISPTPAKGDPIHIKTNKPSYVYQNTGNHEVGMGLLAPIRADGRGTYRFRTTTPVGDIHVLTTTSAAAGATVTRLADSSTLAPSLTNVVPGRPDLTVLTYPTSGFPSEEFRVQSQAFVQISMPMGTGGGGAFAYIASFSASQTQANNDSIVVAKDIPLTFSPLLNDVDADGDPLTITLLGSASSGSVVDNGNGTVTYTPNAGYTGPDDFTYTITDGAGNFDTATVSVDVRDLQTAILTITVKPQADDPGLAASNVNGFIGDAVPLSISIAGSPDTDGSETLDSNVQITGVPSTVQLSAGNNNGGGNWSVPVSALSGLTATGTAAGTFTLKVDLKNIDQQDLTGDNDADDSGESHTATFSTSFDLTVFRKVKVSIDDPVVAEGNSGTTTLTFDVTLDEPSPVTVTVQYSTANGAALAGEDYDAVPLSTITFDPGETSKPAHVTVHGDEIVELDETLFVNLSSPTNATIDDGQGIGTIKNDDEATVEIGDASVVEGGNLKFVVSLSNPVDVDTVITYSTADGAATTSDSDYTGQSSQTLTIPAGQIRGTIVVPTTDDATVERDETLSVTLDEVDTGGRSGGTNGGDILYQNDFESPNGFFDSTGRDVSLQSVNSLYGQPGFLFQQIHTVETLEINGTTAFGGGYQDPSGVGGDYAIGMLSSGQNDQLSLTFDAGNLAFLNFAIDVSHIDLDGVGGPFGPDPGIAPVFEFRLYDSPGGSFNISSPGTLLDGVQISGTSSARNTFEWTHRVVGLSTAGSVDGHVSLVVDLLAGGYAAFDNLVVAASDTQGQLGEAATGTIINDDEATIRISDAMVLEGNPGDANQLVFDVEFFGDADTAVSVDYHVVDGTAKTADSDYGGTLAGTLHFSGSDGQTLQVAVDVTGDLKVELNETLQVVLDNLQADGRAVGLAGSGTASLGGPNLVANGDFEVPVINSFHREVPGGDNFITDWQVTSPVNGAGVDLISTVLGHTYLAHTGAQAVDMAGSPGPGTIYQDLVTEPGKLYEISFYVSSNGSAKANSLTVNWDGSPVSTLSTPALMTWEQHTLAVTATGSTTRLEFVGNLSGNQGAFLDTITVTEAAAAATGIIKNDDSAKLSIGDVNQSETDGTTTFGFEVSLTAEVDASVSLGYQTADGSATEAAGGPGSNDYEAAMSWLVITAGDTSASINVTVNGDNLEEPDEDFFVNLWTSTLDASGRNVTVTDNQGRGLIENDDFAPVANAGGPYTVNEGDPLTLDASGSSDPEGDPLTYRWDVDGNNVYDFTTSSDMLTVTPAQLVTLGLGNGLYTGTVTVEASDGSNTHTAQAELKIKNVAPSITNLTTSHVDQCNRPADGNVTLSGSFFDPGIPEMHTAAVDWGDGSGLQPLAVDDVNDTFSGSHTFGPGVYHITVTVKDSDGAVSLSQTTTANVGGVGLAGGTLFAIGDNDSDHFYFQLDIANNDIILDALLDSTIGTQRWVFDAPAVTHITVIGCAGDDFIRVGDGNEGPTPSGSDILIPTTIFGNEGSDHIWGSQSDNTVDGGPGTDFIHTARGTDVVTDPGGDNQIWTGPGDDQVTTGPGNDHIWTFAGDDVVDAGEGHNHIWTEEGDDRVTTGDGDDEVHTGFGNDIIDAAAGRNTVFSGPGDDQITTLGGDDEIHGDHGVDIIHAGEGHNRIFGDQDDDTITTGAGNDEIYGGLGDDVINAGEGRNRVFSGQDNDTITTGSGDDEIDADSGNDVINAGGGRNHIKAGLGNDTVTSGDGDDYVHADSGDDVINAGGGRNEVWPGQGADRVTLGDGDDMIRADEGDNVIHAGGGQNQIFTGHGNDTITSGDGDDTIRVNGGNNVIDAGGGRNEINTGHGNDKITTGGGDDSIRSEGGNNEIRAGDGQNRIFTGGGNDLVIGGSGRDEVDSSHGDDIIYVGGGDDTVRAGGGNDVLVGAAGNDFLYADQGRDILIGGVGRDEAQGGDNDDLLIGGSATNEADLAALDAAMAAWEAGNLAGTLSALGSLIDDSEFDRLLGGNGIDEILPGIGDEVLP